MFRKMPARKLTIGSRVKLPAIIFGTELVRREDDGTPRYEGKALVGTVIEKSTYQVFKREDNGELVVGPNGPEIIHFCQIKYLVRVGPGRGREKNYDIVYEDDEAVSAILVN